MHTHPLPPISMAAEDQSNFPTFEFDPQGHYWFHVLDIPFLMPIRFIATIWYEEFVGYCVVFGNN